MSVYPEFPTVAAALEAWRAGKCPRRHVLVDGQVRDMLAEDRPVRVQREEYAEPKAASGFDEAFTALPYNVADLGSVYSAIVIDDGVQIVTDAPAPDAPWSWRLSIADVPARAAFSASVQSVRENWTVPRRGSSPVGLGALKEIGNG